MKHISFVLDVPPPTPMDEFLWAMEDGGWIIAAAVLLVIGAAIGIAFFTRNKKHKENEK